MYDLATSRYSPFLSRDDWIKLNRFHASIRRKKAMDLSSINVRQDENMFIYFTITHNTFIKFIGSKSRRSSCRRHTRRTAARSCASLAESRASESSARARRCVGRAQASVLHVERRARRHRVALEEELDRVESRTASRRSSDVDARL